MLIIAQLMFIILMLYGRLAGAQRALTRSDMKRIFVMQRPYLPTQTTRTTLPHPIGHSIIFEKWY